MRDATAAYFSLPHQHLYEHHNVKRVTQVLLFIPSSMKSVVGASCTMLSYEGVFMELAVDDEPQRHEIPEHDDTDPHLMFEGRLEGIVVPLVQLGDLGSDMAQGRY